MSLKFSMRHISFILLCILLHVVSSFCESQEDIRTEVMKKNANIHIKDLSEALSFTQIGDLQETQTKQTRYCPNGCSGSNGYCVNNVCSCNSGWSGSDCSIGVTTLTNGQLLLNQAVSTFNWNYYSIAVSGGSHNLIILINQTSSGDCDEYVQVNGIPTRSSYYKRDITTASTVTITIENVASGTWYIGVYGFQGCSFNIKALVSSACPNLCSGHGNCISGVCRCNNGYTGNDCSASYITMSSGQTYSGSVSTAYWNYYLFNYQSGNLLSYTMTTSGDCDIYLRLNQIPTILMWDYSNVTSKNVSTINVVDAQFGNWYVGIYGFASCTYNLFVGNPSSICPNDCSKRGSCDSNNICNCGSDYTGNYCQTRKNPLTNGQSDTGYVKYNTWNYYTYVTNTANNFAININQVSTPGKTGDCDLYVKANSQPNRASYDYQDITTSDNTTLIIEDPGQQTWYIGIFGWMECNYIITTYETSDCPDNCGGPSNGICTSDGTCICNDGFTGDNCENALSILQNNSPQQATIPYNGWIYYSFTLQSSSALYILLKETSTTGLIWVYVAKTTPSLRQYLYSDTQTNTNTHVISIELDSPETVTYEIGVYGNPFILPTQNASYSIIGWSPNF